MRERAAPSRRHLTLVSWLLISLCLYLTSLHNYLLFHSISEIFSVIIAAGVFMMAWNSRSFLENDYFLFLGIAYLFVGTLDLVHALAYKGMGVFPGYGADLPTQLWIASRYLEALSLSVAPYFLDRKLKLSAAFSVYGSILILLSLAIFAWRVFPVCFMEGVGLTTFKKVSEYLISLILLGALGFLLKKRREFDPAVLQLLAWSILLTIGSEIALTFYVSVYGFFNFIGHLLKIISFYLIYKAIIETGLVKPYNLLFRDLKMREEALQRERDTARRAAAEIKELNRALEIHVDRLEAVNRELEAFSYSVSHDLRAPLRAINGFSWIMLEEYSDQLDDEGKRYLNLIKENTQRMALLIDGILSLSRLGRLEMKVTEMDMGELATGVVKELKTFSPERACQFRLSPLPPARGDRMMIHQVLVNLLSNAVKFTRFKEAPVIEVGGWSEEHENTYYVKDNGSGFNMRYADKLFGTFQRLHRQEEFEGTGIGLAIVQRIIQRHGGRVWAEGKVNEGAAFYFTLPK